jgi:uncharacterized SAM-binding protein YcdF (DUF218 family)
MILAGALSLLPRWRGIARATAVLAAASLFLCANGPVANWLLGTLENEFPAGQDRTTVSSLDTIVVLTGYARVERDLPVTSYLNDASALRLMEAMRLLERIREGRIVIAGHEDFPGTMKTVLEALGVPSQQILVESKSMNTYESAVNLREILGDKVFFLVTSAGHMPRTMRTFHKQGLRPIPAPTHFVAVRDIWRSGLIPSGHHLHVIDLAVHEYVGLLWYRVSGRI